MTEDERKLFLAIAEHVANDIATRYDRGSVKYWEFRRLLLAVKNDTVTLVGTPKGRAINIREESDRGRRDA